jgi:hypothetical protein
MVNVPEPAQGSPPVSVHVPVMLDQVVVPDESVVPVAVPVRASVLPPDCTVNAKSAVGVVPVAVTTNVPPAVLPVIGKHGPVVRKLI